MGSNNIHVVYDTEGNPLGATLDTQIAQSYVAMNKGTRYKTVPKLRQASAASSRERNAEITDSVIRRAITAKLQGISLSKFAKTSGVNYPALRDAVNAEWGYTKPWPKSTPTRRGSVDQREGRRKIDF